MKHRLYHAIANASEMRAFLVLLFVIILLARRKTIIFISTIANWLYVRELYIFPPLAFISNYFALLKLFPPHPMSQIAVIASSFMSATLTLFMLRPPKRFQAHWIN